MRRPDLIIDSFAGGGGASLGIEWATGRSPDVAVNHDPAAIAMHAANHPTTRHYKEDVFRVNPREVTRGRRVGLLWLSPDCTHFSRAKGGTPVKKKIRGLAWVAVKWAVEAAPRVMILENVREFQDWGPLTNRWVCRACEWKGTESQTLLVRTRRKCPRCESRTVCPTEDMVPCPARKGLTFKKFVGRLRGLGYHVEWKVLNAADYGAPTHRRRLFLVARNDGEPVVWPDPTHGDPKKIGRDLFSADLLPWRTAAECIDWSIPCPSIFERKKPLAEKTLRRIALGIKRYVLDNPKPFIVDMQRENRSREVDEPAGTVTTQDNRFQVVVPVLAGVGGRAGQSPATAGNAPANTVTAKNDKALVAPVLTPVTHAGERRANGPEEPLPTVTGANRGELAVVAPVIARIGQANANGCYSNSPADPVTTITSKAEHLLIAPTLVQTGYGERAGQSPRALDIEAPLGTVVGGGAKHALVSAFVAKHFGGVVGIPPDVPLGTVTAVDHHSVVAANMVHLNHGDKQVSGCDEPGRTVTASGTHAALVYSFLTKYFSTGGQWQGMGEPMHTATAKARFGLVTVTVGGEEYVITDIGMRMLKPRELARAQGFPDSYKLTGSATHQVERIGNSVSPPVAEAVVRANCPDLAGRRKRRVVARTR